MSREIKYRVWDEEKKKYRNKIDNNDEMVLHPDGQFKIEKGWCIISGDFVIEQYTGLKDKNGKEIYEGDIVREKIDFNSKMTDGTFEYEVCWDEDTLSWGLKAIGPESIHSDLWECNQSLEVIGNIHENPELLGGEE